MALDLTSLQTLRDALIRARLGGVREIEDQNGERIAYKSDAEMARAIADVETRIAQLQGGTVNVIRFNNSKFGE
ncbi:phage head-tail joining protein [Terricaulis silvestris]|uniref:GpW n=1 Tax=Terricaulis silvestris TaxID=2686094 RepID=A0A6I6MNH8_9CAUL|nr:hypothetical protein [Terricaulis silvestris]QGZ94876.1 hypothetical protein DSM104635_01709 [Terricaulis silvestris]